MLQSGECEEEEVSRFAKTDEEAERRYNMYRSRDPFPKIEPSLLNSADIEDYVAATGMICPFDPDCLKPASYSFALLGECAYWDKDGVLQYLIIEPGQRLKLEPNSIAFVTLEPRLRIPDYIALRFNLKITNVYRGLLLGTGPLVDPGYDGRLHMPLHNLTTNDYTYRGGDPIIWVEFTKISHNKRWYSQPSDQDARTGCYHPFPERKKQDTSLDWYLEKAASGREIRSSIPEAIFDSQKAAKEAREAAENAAKEAHEVAEKASKSIEESRRIITLASAVAVVTILLTIIGLFAGILEFSMEAVGTVNQSQEELRAIQGEREELRTRVDTLERQIERLRRHIEELELFPPSTSDRTRALESNARNGELDNSWSSSSVFFSLGVAGEQVGLLGLGATGRKVRNPQSTGMKRTEGSVAEMTVTRSMPRRT